MRPPPPPPIPCLTTSTNMRHHEDCADNDEFVDGGGYPCGGWAGYDCETQASQWYDQDPQELMANCPISCDTCGATPAPTGEVPTQTPTTDAATGANSFVKVCHPTSHLIYKCARALACVPSLIYPFYTATPITPLSTTTPAVVTILMQPSSPCILIVACRHHLQRRGRVC
jgi:hypothetical protein